MESCQRLLLRRRIDLWNHVEHGFARQSRKAERRNVASPLVGYPHFDTFCHISSLVLGCVVLVYDND